MKKFIQSKLNHSENISNQVVETTTPKIAEKKPDPPAANVQPPLPLVPPPPDVPWIPVNVKQEVQDIEYKDEFGYELKQAAPEQEDIKPSVEICRDFIRGTCNRTGPCRYAHKYELSQLVGIFTFCREFQTKGCTYSKCKYVHADIFEEQNFYRTGYLPPCAFTHQKKPSEVTNTTTSTSVTISSVIQTLPPPPPPPLPPPPPPPPEDPPQPQLPPVFAFPKPPPPLPAHNLSDTLLKEYAAMHTSDPILDMLQSNPLKHSWSALELSNLQEFTPSNPKKCPNCDFLELCLQHSCTKVRKMMVQSEAMNMKIDKLEKKNAKLDAIIMKVLRSNESSFLPSSLDMQYGRDILQWEKFSNLWNL